MIRKVYFYNSPEQVKQLFFNIGTTMGLPYEQIQESWELTEYSMPDYIKSWRTRSTTCLKQLFEYYFQVRRDRYSRTHGRGGTPRSVGPKQRLRNNARRRRSNG